MIMEIHLLFSTNLLPMARISTSVQMANYDLKLEYGSLSQVPPCYSQFGGLKCTPLEIEEGTWLIIKFHGKLLKYKDYRGFFKPKKIARKHSQNSHKDRPKFVRRQFKTKRLVSKNFKDSINALKSSEFM